MTLPEHGIGVAGTTNVSYPENLPSLSLRLAHIFAGVEAGASPSLRGESVRFYEFRPRAW